MAAGTVPQQPLPVRLGRRQSDIVGLAERDVRERSYQRELQRRPVAVPQVRRGVLRVGQVDDGLGVAALDGEPEPGGALARVDPLGVQVPRAPVSVLFR